MRVGSEIPIKRENLGGKKNSLENTEQEDINEISKNVILFFIIVFDFKSNDRTSEYWFTPLSLIIELYLYVNSK